MGSGTLSESDSKALLAAFGVPIVDERLAADPDEAVEMAGAVGYPVVLKLNGEAIAHKTERGLVRLRLSDPDSVRRAATELLAAAGPADGSVTLLVAPMVDGSRELMVGLTRDRQFGPTVMLGLGGVLAEAIADVVFRPAPVDSVHEFWLRAAIGPIPGQVVLLAGIAFHATWMAIAIATYRSRRGAGRARPQTPERDRLLDLARG